MVFHFKKIGHALLRLVTWTIIFLISLSLFSPIPLLAAPNMPQKTILVFGDSLSAAYGMAQSSGWVMLLQKKLTDSQYHYEVINASVSGETTIGGKNRLEAQLKRTKPTIVILELGANDGLRGLPIIEMQKNLSAMIQTSQQSGAKVILIGMKLPPNYGAQYTQSFSQTFQTLSQQFKTPLVPFMLDRVATEPALVQADGLHPNELGQPMILDNIWPAIKPLLKK